MSIAVIASLNQTNGWAGLRFCASVGQGRLPPGRLVSVHVGADPPQTRYVRVGEADVAYQVFGEGSPDYLYCYGLGSHLDLAWDLPGVAAFYRHLASFCRPIFFDRRGTGASGGLRHEMPTWEEWAEDIGAVLDAVGSTEAVLGADLDAGPFAILYAALHPERVKALVLSNTAARYVRADDYPIGVEPNAVDALIELVATSWGTTQLTVFGNPSLSVDDPIAQRSARVARASATPRAAAAQYDYILRNLDVRQALPLIQVPTLVTHTSGNLIVPVELSRYLADHIEGASFLEVQGTDVGGLSAPPIEDLEAIAEFITGERPRVEIESILTTALFTDIVDSTRKAAELGDRRWRSLLDSHDRLVRDQLVRFRGTRDQDYRRRFLGQLRRTCSWHSMRSRNHRGNSESRRRNQGWIAHRRVPSPGQRSQWTGHPYRLSGRFDGDGRGSIGLRHCEGPRCRLWDRVHRAGRARAEGRPWKLEAVRGGRVNEPLSSSHQCPSEPVGGTYAPQPKVSEPARPS